MILIISLNLNPTQIILLDTHENHITDIFNMTTIKKKYIYFFEKLLKYSNSASSPEFKNGVIVLLF